MKTRESPEKSLDPAEHADLGSPPDVMTVDEAAELLRVEKKKIYELVANNQLPGVRRLGRLIRISRGAVLQWLAAR